MKKSIFMIAAIFSMAVSEPVPALADGTQVDLQVSLIHINPGTIKDKPHKAPPHMPSVQVPVVFLDGNTLYFDEPCGALTLQLVDEDDSVVYSVTIPAGTTEWELPCTFEGEYELQIIQGRFSFHGWIELQ